MAAARNRPEAAAKAAATKAPAGRKQQQMSHSEQEAHDMQRKAGNQASMALLFGLLDFSGDKDQGTERIMEQTGAIGFADNHSFAPGQENHLAHEASHVAQQRKRGIVPTESDKGMKEKDDFSHQREAVQPEEQAPKGRS